MSHTKCAECTYYQPASSLLSYNTQERLRNTQPVIGSEAVQLQHLVNEAQKDIKEYSRKLAWLRSRVVALEQECSLFEQHLNHVKPLLSPIRKLPVEILGEIFSYVCTDNTFSYARRGGKGRSRPKLVIDVPGYQLARVCASWRGIVFSMPSLWTTITLSIKSSQYTFADIQVLKSALTRVLALSGRRPLRVNIESNNFSRREPSSIHPAARLLVDECQRWAYAKFEFLDPQMYFDGTLQSLEGKLPLLQEVDICAGRTFPGHKLSMFAGAPRLRSLHIQSTNLHILQLSWNRLQHSTARDMHFEDIALMLTESEDLTQLVVYDPICDEHQPVVTHQLSEFHLHCNDLFEISKLIRCLELPCLKMLELSTPDTNTFPSDDIPRQALLSFFSSFSHSLSSLKLKDMVVEETTLISALETLTCLRSLEILDHQKRPAVTYGLINRMLKPSSHTGAQRALLPTLEQLRIDICHTPPQLTFVHFYELASSRSVPLSAQFRHVNMPVKLQSIFLALRDVQCSKPVLETWESLRVGGLNARLIDSDGVVGLATHGWTCNGAS